MLKTDSVAKLQERQWRALACGLQTGVWLVAAVVLSRRVSGDASGFATQWAACLVGSVAMAISVLTTSLLKGDDPRTSNSEHGLLPEALSLLPGMMLGLALMPAGSGGGLAALLGLFVVAFVAQVGLSTASRSGQSLVRPADVATEAVSEPDWDDALPESDASPHAGDLPLLDDNQAGSLCTGPETQQWMTRSQQDGYDVIEGEVRIDFESGQRLIALHLPFSPPLAATPEFECECLDDIEVSFRTTARHSYGVRVEISRSGSLDQPATATIGWAASAESATEAVAEPASVACDAA